MEQTTEIAVEPLVIPQKKPKRSIIKKKTLIIGGGILVVLISAVILYLVLGRGATGATNTQIQVATASISDVSTTIEGTGTLANGSSENLYIAQDVEIKEVLVSVGDKVTAGDTLATVEEYSLKAALYSASEALSSLDEEISGADSSSSAYYQALKERADTQNVYDNLARIAETNSILAPSDGIITAVGISDNTVAGNSAADTSNSANNNTSDTPNTRVSSDQTTDATLQFAAALYRPSEDDVFAAVGTGVLSDFTTASLITSLNLDSFSLTPVVGEKPLKTIDGSNFEGTVSWSPDDMVFVEGKVYQATIVLKAKGTDTLSQATVVTLNDAVTVSSDYNGSTGELTVTAVFPKLSKKQSDDAVAPGNNSSNSSNSSMNTSSSGSSDTARASNDTTGASSTNAENNTSTAQTEAPGQVAAFGLAQGDKMSITASIDEMDINVLSVGQATKVTISALDNQVFDGEISKVNKTGTSSNGVTKYSAEITLERTDEMLEGMNASVSIVIQESTDTLSIPAAALQSDGTRTFVYTKYDESTGELSGEVDVETGNSDGALVEILSGLSEGDSVCYAITTSSNDGTVMFGGMGGGPGGVGGAAPSFNMESSSDRGARSGEMPQMQSLGGSQ